MYKLKGGYSTVMFGLENILLHFYITTVMVKVTKIVEPALSSLGAL